MLNMLMFKDLLKVSMLQLMVEEPSMILISRLLNKEYHMELKVLLLSRKVLSDGKELVIITTKHLLSRN